MADAAELITRILDPIAFRANEDALLTSAQNRRVQQAESRRADRDQQLQEILAPLQSRRLSQELQLNTLKLEEADRIAQTRISDAALNTQATSLFARAVQSNFDNEVVSDVLQQLKPMSHALTNPNSALFGMDRTLITEALKARQKEDEIDKALKIAQIRTSDQPTLREDQLLTRARELDAQAEQARASGDAIGFQRLKDEANLFRAKAAPRGQTIEVTPGGGTRITTGPLSSSQASAPTTQFQSDTQKKMLAFDIGLSGVNDLLSKLRPEDVGLQGWIGEKVVDSWAGQIDPSLVNVQRVENRTAARVLAEGLIPVVSAEEGTRFSNDDVKRIKEITDILKAPQNYLQAVTALEELKSTIKSRSRSYAERTREPIPDFAKEREEVKADYDEALAAAERQLRANEITPQQHDMAVTEAYRRLKENMRRFHNTIVTGQ